MSMSHSDDTATTLGFVLTATVFVLGFGAIFFCLCFKNSYVPFKSKQPEALLMGFVFALVWSVSNLQAIRFIDPTGFFSHCSLFLVWGQVTFGGVAFMSVLGFRLQRLYYILVLGRDPSGLVFWGTIVFWWMPSLVLAVLTVLFPGRFTTELPIVVQGVDNNDPFCEFVNAPFKFACYGCGALQLLVLFYYNWRIARIRKAFNEFKENQIALGILTALLLINVGLNVISITASSWGGLAVQLSVLVIALSFLVVSLGQPMAGFLFRRKEYLDEFKRGLRDDSIPTALMYDVAHSSSGSRSTRSKSILRSG
ncbi:hypothetical protein HDU91_002045 [Kappamyces sp. JEL0680]|nr:hypothetical protein HDU91_002045 [Kappamyces sp. JEL0680]